MRVKERLRSSRSSRARVWVYIPIREQRLPASLPAPCSSLHTNTATLARARRMTIPLNPIYSEREGERGGGGSARENLYIPFLLSLSLFFSPFSSPSLYPKSEEPGLRSVRPPSFATCSRDSKPLFAKVESETTNAREGAILHTSIERQARKEGTLYDMSKPFYAL